MFAIYLWRVFETIKSQISRQSNHLNLSFFKVSIQFIPCPTPILCPSSDTRYSMLLPSKCSNQSSSIHMSETNTLKAAIGLVKRYRHTKPLRKRTWNMRQEQWKGKGKGNSIIEASERNGIGGHLLPEGGTEQTRTAPASSGNRPCISEIIAYTTDTKWQASQAIYCCLWYNLSNHDISHLNCKL